MSKYDLIVWIVTLAMIVIEAISDVKRREIKIVYLIVAGAIGILALVISGEKSRIISSLFGIAIGLTVIVLAYLTKGGIGYGDGLLLCISGLLLGVRNNIILLLMGCFFSAVVSMFLLVIKKADRKTLLPFVPFLIPAVIVSFAFERIA